MSPDTLAQTGPAMRPDRTLALAGGLIGFALGGFADGILLHQVLQWHHLLSLVPGAALRDIRVQILADGLFHVLMYGLAVLGLALLWRARRTFRGGATDLRLLGDAALGFCLWQVVDAVLFHWVLVIHRIRVDVADPLPWDLGWLAVFGLPSLLVGLWLRRSAGSGGPPRGRAGRSAAAPVLALLVLVAGPVAALPGAGQTAAMVVFRPGMGADETLGAVAALGGRVIWSSRSGGVLAVDLGPGGRDLDLYRRGAVLVSRSALVGGCLALSPA